VKRVPWCSGAESASKVTLCTVLQSKDFLCLEKMATICAMLSVQSPFIGQPPTAKRRERWPPCELGGALMVDQMSSRSYDVAKRGLAVHVTARGGLIDELQRVHAV